MSARICAGCAAPVDVHWYEIAVTSTARLAAMDPARFALCAECFGAMPAMVRGYVTTKGLA